MEFICTILFSQSKVNVPFSENALSKSGIESYNYSNCFGLSDPPTTAKSNTSLAFFRTSIIEG